MLIIAFALQYARERCPKQIGRGRNRPTYRNLTLIVNKKPVKLISRPVGNTGDATRGFEGGVLVVDEASRMPKMFWIAAKPILLTQAGQIWMCSTPFGKQGYFWKRFNEAHNKKDPKARFKVFYIDTETVINERKISDSWTQEQRIGALKILEEDKREMSVMEYGQEYLGLFLDDLQQYFDDDLIQSCMVLKRRMEIIPERKHYLGCDIAGMGKDEGTYEIMDKIDSTTYEHVEHLITKKTRTTQTVQTIIGLNRLYNFKKEYIDSGGGLGTGICDQLRINEENKRKVVEINNASRPYDIDRSGKENKEKRKKILKEDLYNNLLVMMENKEIKLLTDPEIFVSLKSVQYEIHEGRLKIFGRYTHIAEGLIRAAWCKKDKSLNIYVR